MSDFDLARYQDPLTIQRVLHTAQTIAISPTATSAPVRRAGFTAIEVFEAPGPQNSIYICHRGG